MCIHRTRAYWLGLYVGSSMNWSVDCSPSRGNRNSPIPLSHPKNSDDCRESASMWAMSQPSFLWWEHTSMVATYFALDIRLFEAMCFEEKQRKPRNIWVRKHNLQVITGWGKITSWGKRTSGFGASVPFASLYRTGARRIGQVCHDPCVDGRRFKWRMKLPTMHWIVRQGEAWCFIVK